MVMASAGVNVPAGAGAGAGGDGVRNPTAASGATPECRARRRRRLESSQQGSGEAGPSPGPSWVRRLRPAASSRFSSPSSSSSSSPSQGSSEQEEAADPEVQEMEFAPLPPPPPPQLQLQPAVADPQPPEPQPPAGLQLQPAVAGPEPPEPQPPVLAVASPVWPVAFGSLSMAGRMRIMEDTISLHPELCAWPAPGGSTMHFFAVFDGHGGTHVSALCRERMHEVVAEEMAREGAAFLRRRKEWLEASSGSGGASTSLAAFLATGPPAWSERAEEERAWRDALARSFRRLDAMAILACPCGRITRPACGCPLSRAAAVTASSLNNGIVGSTAVVAVLVRGRLVVANCGDSRAVLCRGPAGSPPVPLSFDHKPNRPDERARIEAAGGMVLYNNGYRVRGILAMSRAIGDRLLRPEVIAEPEITITQRTLEDECLILASDGMWDVIDNVTACNVARQCLEDWNPPPAAATARAARRAPAAGIVIGNQAEPQGRRAAATSTASAGGGGAPPAAAGVVVSHEAEPRCLRAAALLARLAVGRQTQDNVSIVVVDLKHRERE